MLNQYITDSVVAPPIVDFKQAAKDVNCVANQKFDLTQAIPNYPTFKRIRDELARDLGDESVGFYGEVPGLAALREQIAKTHVIPNLSPDQVLITSGANQAMYLASTLFFGLGDAVLQLEPYYFNYDMTLKILGLSPYYYRLDANDGFRFRVDKLIGFLQNNPVSGIILISPNNPTGAAYRARDILELLEYTRSKRIEVIVDETYGKFDEFHLKESGLDKFVGNGLALVGSFSKTYSLCGYRVGYLISSSEILAQALKVQDTMIICPSQIGQRAALHGLNLCGEDLADKIEQMTKLTHRMILRGKDLKNYRLASCGPYFAYVRHPFKGQSAKQAALLTYEFTGLLGLPGTIFGRNQDDFIRLSYCNLTMSELDRALDQLIAFDAEVLERGKQWISSEA